MSDSFKKDALNYHAQAPAGKVEIVPTKPMGTQMDLALAYSPGVAEPCLEIADNTEAAYKYTAKGNLVAVISNGTAVLGLGNIGPEASKPVMEGKGVLFKKFAGIDVFDIEIDAEDPDELIKVVKALEPTFGGVNLEDIKAPESFKVEEALKEQMNIPVMHDDQHGTAIISAAALLSALEIVKKAIDKITVVVSGAGASAIACSKLYLSLGVKRENIIMTDSKGVIYEGREHMDPYKALFATTRKERTLAEAMKGADVFLGLSKGGLVSKEMVQSMGPDAIVFALANPDPEISYADAMAARPDIIMATGRSDHPNQVNNVLGFPYIFRGALDVRATAINEEMKLAAVKALAQLAKMPVPELVTKAYGGDTITFGKNYLIPKPLDPRLITAISPAVAKAAMESGVARTQINNWEAYELELQRRIGVDQRLMNPILQRAKLDPKRVVFAEADNPKILRAAYTVVKEGIAFPILLGNLKKIRVLMEDNDLDFECEIYDPYAEEKLVEAFGQKLFEKRQRKGMTAYESRKLMRDRNYFGAMMVETGKADALISGLTKDYPTTVRPALQCIGVRPGVKRLAGMYILNTKKGACFLADTTLNTDPTAEELVDIIGSTVQSVRFFDYEPRVAVLSYSNFGSSKGQIPAKVQKAVATAKEQWPNLVIEGDIQGNVAVDTTLQQDMYPFSKLADQGANTFIFPNLAAGNIAYKLLMELGGCEAIGPILIGMDKPVHILQLGSSAREIVNMVAIAVVDAQQQAQKV